MERLLYRASQLGSVTWLRAVMREIDDRLHADPTEFGEPLRELPEARLRVYTAARIPLVVLYAVHKEQPVVFVTAIRVMGGHGLEEPQDQT